MNSTAFETRDTVAERPGYDPTPAHAVARVRPMLHEERVVWLSTVRPDGTPHLVPTWFWWDGEALVVFSKPGAAKVRNLRANPRLMIAVGDPEDDFSVGLIEAEATAFDEAVGVPDGFFAKYASELGPGRLDPVTFRELYTLAIRIVPTRYLAWHGRGETHDRRTTTIAAPAEHPRPSIVARLAASIGRLVAPSPLPAGAA
ncbi:MAG TPA: pyridoxamine 5'-phosphate oxidase family protein [Candidatus Limnocylindrales bacterium]|jgi:PPOX class probable F420-dependent enzyme|nr:pyridoxamine 5'-phosphate oxidase family protein [Candidatus Limnocylindrales bacterium]